jgi:hypothetical protein
MPPIEKTDYPALDMGHSFSRTDISIVGLEVQVYGLEEIKGSNKPIVGLVRFLSSLSFPCTSSLPLPSVTWTAGFTV